MVSVDVDDFGKVQVIRIKGEFFLQYVRQVEEIWNSLVAKEPEVIAINCKDLIFLDSSGIGTLVKFLNNDNARNIKFLFFDLNESISRIFSKAKLNKIFTILSREDFEKFYLDQS